MPRLTLNSTATGLYRLSRITPIDIQQQGIVGEAGTDLSERASDHACGRKLSMSSKASQRKKQKSNSQPSSAIRKASRLKHLRQLPESSKPDHQKINSIAGAFCITKPNHLNQLKSFEPSKCTFSPEQDGLGQTYQAEFTDENAELSVLTIPKKVVPVEEHLLGSNTESDTFQKIHQSESKSQLEDVTDTFRLIQDDGSDLLHSSSQPDDEMTFLAMQGIESCPSVICKNIENQSDRQTDTDEMIHTETSGFSMHHNENIQLDNNDDLLLNASNFSSSNFDDDFQWSDKEVDEMIHSAKISQGLENNPASDEITSDPWLDDGVDDIDILCSVCSFDSPKPIPCEDGVEPSKNPVDVVESVSSSNCLDSNANCPFTSSPKNAEPHEVDSPRQLDDFYEDKELENELFKLTTTFDSSVLPSSSSPIRSVIPNTESQTTSPVTAPKQPSSPEPEADISHLVSFTPTGAPIPFLRPPFSKPIRDRSPILGLTSHTVLRVCFRIGEALNAAVLASRAQINTIFELYACVVASQREPDSFKQTFTFADIFICEKPPFLQGTYSLWRGVDQWDHDSKAFLGTNNNQGKMARIIGQIARNQDRTAWHMIVLSIWQVGWEDIGITKGIVCP